MKHNLLPEFKRNIHNITEYYKNLIVRTKNNERIGSVNEWIVDNYYIISEQGKCIENEFRCLDLKTIKNRRKRYLYSFIYGIIKEDEFNINMLNIFNKLNNYQDEKKDYFSYAEIRLICLLIRMVLISELNDLTKRLNDRLLKKDSIDHKFILINKEFSRTGTAQVSKYLTITNNIVNDPYYVEQLNYKLKGMGKLSESAFTELRRLLSENKLSIKDLIKRSNDDMATDNFLMINIFNSLKQAARLKIEYLYENISFTEKALINEKLNIYDKMCEGNKAEYRDRISKISRINKINEYEYSKVILNKANKENKHVGWYLFGNKNYQFRFILYFLSIVFLTSSFVSMAVNYFGWGSLLILIVPISGLSIEIINQILRGLTKANSIFKLEFKNGLPKEFSTMVVVPTLVKNKEKVEKVFDNLEVYYLSNCTDNLYFTLLGDCSSEKTQDIDADKEIVEAGLQKVEQLNTKYGKKIFNFIYRNRIYSDSEECYLGFERKRGALLHFNKLLLNKFTLEEKNKYFKAQTFDDFNTIIKYVITLDTDTKLVLNTALKLIGAMAHPINMPVLSEDKKKVISGYGIMQPRVSIDVEVTNKSQYSQLFAGLGGLDIYTTAYFDLYQDVFGEGSFVGKGIYDLEVFEQVLDNTFPNNLILSHDLLEGSYLRCGLINDVELFDDYPAGYLSDAARHHRWNRGDWQIIGWLKGKVHNATGEVVKNPITILSKWKIFDNLRRSLMSISLLLIILIGFTVGHGYALYYFILVLIVISLPIFFYLFNRVIDRSKHDVFLKYYLNLIRGVFSVINKSIVVLAVLPYEACLYTDSIARSLYRMIISKKRLLNWTTAEEVEKKLVNNLKNYIVSFIPNYIFALLLIIMCLIYKPDQIVLASVISFIWLCAPVLMYLMSRSIPIEEGLGPKEKNEIMDIAVKTWGYFDDFLNNGTNYLIPDNFQLNRAKKVDYKTSPTNIGFSLVSVISAFELNLINEDKAIEKLSNIIKTIEKLEKWNGQLFNWYDIYALKKIYPYFISTVDNGNLCAGLYTTKGFLEKHNDIDLLRRVKKLILEMDFSKLYNKDLNVFSIGYNWSEQILLPYNYNNFASESRLTSFIAIAKKDVSYNHWFALDKTLVKYKHYKGVASWSGTAFEYFMPLIFMKTFRHTLIDETYYFAYYTEREFVKKIDSELPWGISESAYNELDDSENYKYSAFGIPYLKLHDSSIYPIVISPYSSLMAISIDDHEVYHNIRKLKNLNMYDQYGFYESYDNEDKAVVKSYYAHHQGMILTSLTNYLKDNIIQKYFHSDKSIQAVEMLLKEKVQIRTYIDLKIAKYKKYQYSKEPQENDTREYGKLEVIPEVGVLSNGFYSLLMNDRGSSFSKYKNLQINRYRETSNEDYGIFVYVKNLNNGKVWSNTYAPLNVENSKYKTIFASDRIKFIREDGGILTTTEITVVKEHNAEIRKITLQNNTNSDTKLEITTYGEVVICRNEEDINHPAFNSLTIHSEIDKDTSSLIFSRNSRTKENHKYYLIGRMFLGKDNGYPCEFETSRMNFIGRNRTVSNPSAIEREHLSNTVENSIDPIMGIKKCIGLKAHSKENVYLIVGFGKSREQIIDIVNTYKDEATVEKAFEMATVLSNMTTSYANLTGQQKRLYGVMLKYIYNVIPTTEQRIKLLEENVLSQSGLWKFGISGDYPIILVEIDKIEDVGFIDEVLRAHEYYKSKALNIDVVIINNEDYDKEKLVLKYVNDAIYRINNLNYLDNSFGKIFTISSSNLSFAEEVLLHTVARISLNASSFRSFEEQVYNIASEMPKIKLRNTNGYISSLVMELPKEIDFYNGLGGFVNDGREYVINGIDTPMPWINVIANKHFGSIISNNFGGFTYTNNSREFKLTSWSNNAVSDTSSEMLIINNQRFKPSIIKHGFGYSIIYGKTEQYEMVNKVYVGDEDRIKIYEIKITNKLKDKQNIKFDLVLKMVLGDNEEYSNRYILYDFDKGNNALRMRNVYNDYFRNANVFVSSTELICDYEINNPKEKSITVNIDLESEETKDFSFIIGYEGDNEILSKYKNLDNIKKEFNKVVDTWQDKLTVVNVKTPDKSFDYMINGWYLYQVYASRLLSKAAFYQVGGAIGFRDQLQDVMALLYSNSAYVRDQILEHAKHQFKEGDVLHWWHEEIMLGSRTKISDDYLWLVYVTNEYVKITGDYSILDEGVSFVTGETLSKYEDEKGITYSYTLDNESLYDHLKLCITRAISQFGDHNLPLMGSGDWNDGMNKVGNKGKGESVFVGFFLYDLLGKIIDLSKRYNDNDFIGLCLERRELLKNALDNNAWDGSWYLRAYFDNGEPLGSKNNLECKIDLLCQSWSILSGVADDKRRRKSLFMETEDRLVDSKNKLIQLLTPSFNELGNNPGYIKDYLGGVRENGGQYTHAALWYIAALLEDGKIDKANEYYQMINPINRSLQIDDVNKYKVEPYVIAADIYDNPGHEGQGGWTWYTGSAAWAYKIGLESILGFKKVGDTLSINPKINSSWDGFKITYKYLDTNYLITVNNDNHVSCGIINTMVDGKIILNNIIDLVNDKVDHEVIINMKEES